GRVPDDEAVALRGEREHPSGGWKVEGVHVEVRIQAEAGALGDRVRPVVRPIGSRGGWHEHTALRLRDRDPERVVDVPRLELADAYEPAEQGESGRRRAVWRRVRAVARGHVIHARPPHGMPARRGVVPWQLIAGHVAGLPELPRRIGG